jgi:F-type H+-transporting ATPase subunit a
MEHHFTWFDLVLHGDAVKFTPTVASIAVILVVLAVAFVGRAKFANINEAVLPDGGLTVSALLDNTFSGLLGMMKDIIGPKEYKKHLWFIGAMALFIFFANLSGNIPGFPPPTQFITTTAACGILSFAYYNYCGIRTQGLITHLKHFMGPVVWLAPLMIPVEIISHFARPMSLALRLFGNIYADHTVLAIVSGMLIGAMGTSLFVPLPLLALGLLVALVQTVIFSILSIVYIGMAVEQHDDHH